MKNAFIAIAGLSLLFANSAQAAYMTCGPVDEASMKKHLGYLEQNFTLSLGGGTEDFSLDVYRNNSDSNEIATVTKDKSGHLCIAMKGNPFPG